MHNWREAFDGLMLSDGNLDVPGRCRNPRYQQTSSNPEFLEWASQWLPTRSRISGPYEWRQYQYWMLRTPTDAIYLEEYRRWYPDGRKRIPHDFIVTPLSMLAAYLGDGSSCSTTKAVYLATRGFPREDVERLVEQLRSNGFDCAINRKGDVYFRAKSMEPFLEYIGPCPVRSYEYKWFIPDHW